MIRHRKLSEKNVCSTTILLFNIYVLDKYCSEYLSFIVELDITLGLFKVLLVLGAGPVHLAVLRQELIGRIVEVGSRIFAEVPYK